MWLFFFDQFQFIYLNLLWCCLIPLNGKQKPVQTHSVNLHDNVDSEVWGNCSLRCRFGTNSCAYQITRLQIQPTFLKTISRWTLESRLGCGFYSSFPSPTMHLSPNSLSHSAKGYCLPSLLGSVPGPEAFAEKTTVGRGNVTALGDLHGLRVPSLRDVS